MRITKTRDYQHEGIDFLTTPRVHRSQFDTTDPIFCRALLSDAPGSGKTHQALEAALKLASSHPHWCIAVFAPAHLVEQWYDHCVEQYPELRILSIEGIQKEKTAYLNATQVRIVIVSIQSMRRKPFVDQLTQFFIRNHVNISIIDESHYVKNRESIQAYNIRQITRPDFCPHTFLLTATPIMREADDIFMQLRIIDPFTFSNFDAWLHRYCWFHQSAYGPQNVSLKKGVTFDDYILGRSYAQIGLQLPPIIPPSNSPDALIKTSLPKPYRVAYDDVKNTMQHALDNGEIVLTMDNAMQVMHTLRHLTANPSKQESLLSFLETDPGPHLIACFYRQSAYDLRSFLVEHGHSASDITVITGADVPAHERPIYAKRAQATSSILIATMPSISEGVDLSHMRSVHFYEENFTPGGMYQFLSRVRRHRNPDEEDIETLVNTDEPPFSPQSQGHYVDQYGVYQILVDYTLPTQETPNDELNSIPVIVRYYHAKNTIDEKIHAVQSNRAISIKDIIKVELVS